MRIAVSGVPGTGKTTLCNLIANHTDLAIIPEIEDVVIIEMGYENGRKLIAEKGDAGFFDWFFLSLKRKRQEDELPHYVCDKTVFDMGARWFAHMRQGATDEQHEEVIHAMKEAAERRIYDQIIYLPLDMNMPVADDCLRTTEPYLRYKRSLLLQGIMKEFGVKPEHYNFKFGDSPEKVLTDLGLDKFKR